MSSIFVEFCFFKLMTAYEMRIGDWSSDVCSSDLFPPGAAPAPIVEVAITHRIAVAVIVEHPHAIAGIIIIVVPAAAKADVDETAAIIRRVVTVVAIAVVIGIDVIIIIDRKSVV